MIFPPTPASAAVACAPMQRVCAAPIVPISEDHSGKSNPTATAASKHRLPAAAAAFCMIFPPTPASAAVACAPMQRVCAAPIVPISEDHSGKSNPTATAASKHRLPAAAAAFCMIFPPTPASAAVACAPMQRVCAAPILPISEDHSGKSNPTATAASKHRLPAAAAAFCMIFPPTP